AAGRPSLRRSVDPPPGPRLRAGFPLAPARTALRLKTEEGEYASREQPERARSFLPPRWRQQWRPQYTRGSYCSVSTPAPATSTAIDTITIAAARAQKTAGYAPRPRRSSDAPTGPTARAPLAPRATAPAMAP